MHSIIKRGFTSTFGFFLCLAPCAVMAQNTVAFFAPNLDFKDGAERNAYISKVAKALSSKTGMAWEGKAFARAADFEAARSSIDVAILDADYFTQKGGSLTPVAMLSASGQTTRPLKIIARKNDSDKLYDYRGKRLAVVSNTALTPAFVTASALGNEIKASEYFSSIDEVRDVRSAINAVEVGKADLSLVFDGYDSGFTTLYTSPAVSLPSVALNSARVTGANAEQIRAALLDIDVRASSFVTGTTAYNAQDAGAYRRVANTRKSATLNYQPIEPEAVKVEFQSVQLSERSGGIVLNPFQIRYVPSIEDFDRVLEKNL